VHGAVEKGAKVELNGSVRVQRNGRFSGVCFLSEGNDTVRLTVTRGGKTRTLARRFIIRKLAQ